ncbi:MAG TPA: glucuronate isomerase [Rhizomicrobium sp.]|nr:glucuronate isomerase [Rhizomicrobium sp.]
MTKPLQLDPDRFFPAEQKTRALARDLFARVEKLPILSPHGHTDPKWFATDAHFEDATSLFLWPDHYLLRMLCSAGLALEDLGLVPKDGKASQTSRRAVWKLFARNYHLFRGTPSRLWLDHAFATVFGLDVRLEEKTADHYFDVIGTALARDAFRPRALFRRFNLEVLATTEGALDPLHHHADMRKTWDGRVITTFRPDDVTDPDGADFVRNIEELGRITGENAREWRGYLKALENRRAFFRAHGATATDHGPATAQTADLPPADCQSVFDRILGGKREAGDAELFRAQMLTEMARMACDDGMTMQIHPGSFRNHNRVLFAEFGPHIGADIPIRVDYVHALKPLLDRFGNRRDLTVILFTLDESNYARELAPLAGHYPCLKLGPAWWFNDSPEGMLRFRRQVTETAGFYNTVGFNDDTRAFFSIPARHDLARRIDAGYLAELVATHRLERDEAEILIAELAYSLPKTAYRL